MSCSAFNSSSNEATGVGGGALPVQWESSDQVKEFCALLSSESTTLIENIISLTSIDGAKISLSFKSLRVWNIYYCHIYKFLDESF